MQNFLKTCKIFHKWEGEFRWFTVNFSFLNLNSDYSIMQHHFTLYGLSFVQFFPIKLDPDKAGLLSVRNTVGMYHVLHDTAILLTGGALMGRPQVPEQTVMSKAPKLLWWAKTRAAELGGIMQVTAHPLGLRQREFHKWSGLIHAQQSSRQTRLLHPVTQLLARLSA